MAGDYCPSSWNKVALMIPFLPPCTGVTVHLEISAVALGPPPADLLLLLLLNSFHRVPGLSYSVRANTTEQPGSKVRDDCSGENALFRCSMNLLGLSQVVCGQASAAWGRFSCIRLELKLTLKIVTVKLYLPTCNSGASSAQLQEA